MSLHCKRLFFLCHFVFVLLGKKIHSTKPESMDFVTKRIWCFLPMVISGIFYQGQIFVCLICKSIYWVVLFCKYLKFYQDQCRDACQDVLGTSHYLSRRGGGGGGGGKKMGGPQFFTVEHVGP